MDETVNFKILSESDQMLVHVFRGDALLNIGKFSEASAEYDAVLKVHPDYILARLGNIKVAANRGELSAVEALIDELLKIAPEEPMAWNFYGDFFLGKSDLELAYKGFSKALEFSDSNFLVRAKRAIVLVDMRRPKESKLDVEILLRDAPEYFMSHFAMGRLELANQNYQQAQTALEQALKYNDEHLPTYYFLGIAQLMLSNLNQASQNLSHFISGHPQSVVAHKALATAQFRLGHFETAKANILPVINSFPEDHLSNELMARIEFALGNSSAGIGHLENLAKIAPDQADIHTRLAVANMLGGNHNDAVQSVQNAIDLNGESTQAQSLIAFLYIQAKEYDKARQAIDSIRKIDPDAPASWNLEGVLHWNQKNYPLAKTAFKKALAKEPGSPGPARYLAQLLVKENAYEEARNVYQSVLEQHPNHYDSSLGLAELDSLDGRFDSMLNRLKTLMDVYPVALEPRLVAAEHYLRYGQPEKALPLLQNLDSIQALTPKLLALQLEAELALNQGGNALSTADKLVKESSDNAYAHYLAATVHLRNRDIPRVRSALTRSLELTPKFKLSQVAMVRLLVMERKPQEAGKILTTLLKEEPEDPQVLLLKGWYEAINGRPGQAISYYQRSNTNFPSSNTVLGLAKAEWQAKGVDAAITTLTQWTSKYPKDVVARYGLSAYYGMAENTAKAVEQLDKIIEQQPNYLFALNDLAWLLRSSHSERALTLINKAVLIAPSMAGVLSTQAMVLAERGQFDKALRISGKLLKAYPGSGTYRYYHAVILFKKGSMLDAKSTLLSVLDEDQGFGQVEQARQLLMTIEAL